MLSIRRAFTLVEFIVILVIIAVLAAMLFPVMYRPIEGNPKRYKCQSNLKQISLGIRQYIQDYDEKFPPASLGNGQGWADTIQPYIKGWELFRCPLTESVAGKTTDYFYNRRVASQRKANFISQASTILLGECLPNSPTNISFASMPVKWVKSPTSPVQRHLIGANYAFVDGHVKWFEPYKAVIQSPKQRGVYTFLAR